MTMKLYISPNYSEIDEYITISKSGFFFSAEFIDKNKLTTNEYCQFFTSSESDYKFGVTFSKEKDEGSFKIINTMRGKYKDKTMSRCVTASAFFNNTPIFKELTKNNQRNRFSLKFAKEDNCYIFNVIPSFEISKKPNDIPGDITGIYKCFNKDKHVLYIGKGNIKSRIKEHITKGWDLFKVDYSVIKDQDEMFKYESYHLEQYKKENGAYPSENIIGGRRIN
jgi:hypothetical protein